MEAEKSAKTEKYTVSGEELVAKVKKLIHEGNIRRVRVLQNGRVILEIPLSVGAPAAAIGILVAPCPGCSGSLCCPGDRMYNRSRKDQS